MVCTGLPGQLIQGLQITCAVEKAKQISQISSIGSTNPGIATGAISGPHTSHVRNAQHSDGTILNDSTIVWEERGGAGDGTRRNSTVGEGIALRTEVVWRTGLDKKESMRSAWGRPRSYLSALEDRQRAVSEGDMTLDSHHITAELYGARNKRGSTYRSHE